MAKKYVCDFCGSDILPGFGVMEYDDLEGDKPRQPLVRITVGDGEDSGSEICRTCLVDLVNREYGVVMPE